MTVQAVLNKQVARVKELMAPKLELLRARWSLLQPREQQLLAVMALFLVLVTVFFIITGLLGFQRKLAKDINNLNKFTIYSRQAAIRYKSLNKIEANTFNQVSLDQVKGDVKQIFQTENPDILIQDGQMTINIPNAQFSQVMTLLDQFRRSYDIFPSQVSITRQTRAGFVSFNATFWVKQ